jgi:PhnB protein
VIASIKSASVHFVVNRADEAIAFYAQAFGAEEVFRLLDPADGRVGHAELRFGDTVMMLADEYPDFGALSPESIGGSPVAFHLQTDEVDALVQRSLSAGATLLREPTDQSFGQRVAQVLDPFGHRWSLNQTIERVESADMQQRWNEEANA